MRSFARALSSSRRAPPKAASKRCSVIASSSVTVWSRLRDPRGPGSATLPWSIVSCTRATMSFAFAASTARSRNWSTSSKFCPVSMCSTGNGSCCGRERFGGEMQQYGGVLAAGEEQHRPLALGNDLAQNEEGVGLENVEVVSGVRGGQGRRHDVLGCIVF